MNDRLSLIHILCERAGKELPGSVMLITRLDEVILQQEVRVVTTLVNRKKNQNQL